MVCPGSLGGSMEKGIKEESKNNVTYVLGARLRNREQHLWSAATLS